jgi:hypothetical protein
MSAPKNQDVLLSGHVSRAGIREPRHGEELWRLSSGDHVLVCELIDDSPVGAGWEVRLRKDGELTTGHRCEAEAIARYTANAFRQDYLRNGWTVAH